MPLDTNTIATLLAAQGYDDVPADDLAEIVTSVNHMLERALAWDADAPFDDEPWAAWPLEGAHG